MLDATHAGKLTLSSNEHDRDDCTPPRRAVGCGGPQVGRGPLRIFFVVDISLGRESKAASIVMINPARFVARGRDGSSRKERAAWSIHGLLRRRVRAAEHEAVVEGPRSRTAPKATSMKGTGLAGPGVFSTRWIHLGRHAVHRSPARDQNAT